MTEKEQELRDPAYSGHIEKIMELFERGVSVNTAFKDGITALHKTKVWAPHLTGKNFLGCAGMLVENGVDVNARDKWGATHLYLAASEGFYETVLYFHSKGAEIDIPLYNGFTPLHEAAETGQVPVLKLLVDHDADLSIGLVKFFDGYVKGDTAFKVAEKAGVNKALNFLKGLKG
ncbi:MAG: ankyrin repeat domain-containing protein [Spirochaetales bacterium]|nr:ankyrin repeat domain-containing protein [Spirochaetales bacterium]